MNKKKIIGVIFDWAGTTVDFGCLAPSGVFVDVFQEVGIEISMAQAREPMGMNKQDHIREILKNKNVSEQWKLKFGKSWNEEDISMLYNQFIYKQLNILKNYSKIIPGLLEVQNELKNREIKIGTTTGYNDEMIDIVSDNAKHQGFTPDTIVCSSDVVSGRPLPWMAIQAAMELNLYPFEQIIKVGDTIADIEEGLNAGMWSIAVVDSSNEMGLSLEEFNNLTKEELDLKRRMIKNKFQKAGAHAVINKISELIVVIDYINEHLNNNIKPQKIEY